MKPVYIINGFLGSGKTEFINFTLDQPYFQSSGKTLLLLCEEGEEEYDPYLSALPALRHLHGCKRQNHRYRPR